MTRIKRTRRHSTFPRPSPGASDLSRIVSTRHGWWTLRHLIDEALSEAGVVIAFPQRDVHLDATGPLAVQLVPPPGGKLGS